jgi:pimeloyl-ACP methyl ester carboxylesterase
MRVRVVLAPAVALVLITAGCTSGTSSSAPIKAGLVRRTCDTSKSLPPTDCYWLDVPEHRGATGTHLIRLWVAVIHERGTTASSPTVLSLSGGPGYAGSTAFIGGNVAFAGQPVNAVIVDQRGTGRSRPRLDCPQLDVPGDATSPWSSRLADARAAASGCRARYVKQGIDVDGYDTVENAADLVELRKDLHLATWIVDATSYGGRLAQELLRQDAAGASALLLDSPITYAPQGPVSLVQRANDALDRLGVAATMKAAAFVLDAHPVSVTLTDSGGTAHKVTAGGQELRAFTFAAEFDSDLLKLLPGVLKTIAGGATEAVAAAAKNASGFFDDRATGMYDIVTCADEQASFTKDDRALIQDPGQYGALLLAMPWPVCDAWGLHPTTSSAGAATTDVPVLLEDGSLDPVTAPAWAADITARMPHATVVVANGFGHGVTYANDCLKGITNAFLADPAAHLDTACASVPRPA